MTNIYVGNLPYSTVEQELIEHFGRWGRVERATLVFDRETGRPRGFGFVEMQDEQAAAKAIAEAHGEPFNGRPLTVNEARPRTPHGSTNTSAAVNPAPPRSDRDDTPERGYQNSTAAAAPNSAPTKDITSPTGGGYTNQIYN